MLQTNKLPPSATGDVAVAELSAYFASFVRRQYPIILFVALLTMGLGAVYVISTPSSYTAQATMIIDTRKVQLFQQQSIMGELAIDTAMVASQVEILKSENIAAAVIKELRLFEDPEFVSPQGGLLSALSDFIPNLFGPPDEHRSEFELARAAMGSFKGQLNVKRSGLTYVIEISFRSRNPEHAAQIANAVADAYVVDQLNAKYQATRRASQWLQDRIKELRDQASTAERAVVEFKAKNNIVNIGGSGGGRLVNEQQLGEINSQLVVARAQVAEARARLTRIESILRSDLPDATVTDTLNSTVVSKLRSQYLDLANREADWSVRYGSNHLAAVNLRNQMRGIRSSILDELRRLAESYKSDYEIAKQREEEVQKRLTEAVAESQTTNQAQVVLRELESSAQTYRTLYDNFLQRYMETVQQQSFPISEARLITAASRPLSKSHPKTNLILALTAFGGGILGLALGWLRDLSDRVFRSTSQVETTLQVNCIAALPALTNGITKPLLLSQGTIGADAKGPRMIVRDSGLLWSVVDAPFSRFTESMRSIKIAADLDGVSKLSKVIGVTSTLPNEGKSTIATNFAQLISHSGGRVILVDGDLRNPSLSRSLAPTANAGLLDVLAGRAILEDAVWTEPSTNLKFLPANVRSRFAHTNEVLASDAAKKLFDNLRQRFDYVVVDLSPLAPVVDARSTAHFVDSYIFVTEWGRTSVNVVEHALNDAREVYERLLGVVLNKANLRVLGRYGGYGGSYYHNKYYHRYGYTE